MRFNLPAKALMLACAILTLVILTGYHRVSAQVARDSGPRGATHEAYMLPQPEALRAMSLGYNQLAADLVWIRSLGYFGKHWHLDRDFRWLDNYINTIITLDPDFIAVYHWAGVAVMYGGVIDNESVMVSNRFLEMGHEHYPDDWLLNFMLGVNYRFELLPETDEQARTWGLLGASYLAIAAEQPEAPSWLALTARKTLSRFGAGDEAIRLDLAIFLNTRGVLSATIEAEMQLHINNPNYARRATLQLTDAIAAGVHLRETLPPLDFLAALQERRRLYLDLDSDAGYLPWGLRVLMRGESDRRVESTRRLTPVDRAFWLTLDAVSNGPLEH